ncbi:hypothetical protein ACTXGL_10995 [Psychrobacter sp. T6-6]|uniref:hypothetical protein n=1 Tax=Psychrobacter sp. T6-6 TaxID=3457452 RepID=UPI003FCF091B
MGIIYEVMRKMEESEKEVFDDNEHKSYVLFYEFIIIIALYGDDSEKMVANYLISDDEFLKLDYYIYDSFFSKVANPKIPYNKDGSFSLHEIPNLDELISEYGFHKQKYNDCGNEDQYPTEFFLEQVLDDHVENIFNDKYWKIEDILSLDCIFKIGLDVNAFEECYEALNSSPSTTLRYIRERKEFKERLVAEQKKASRSQNIDPDIYDSAIEKLKKKENEVKDLLEKIRNLEGKSLSSENEPMHPRTANNASKIIGALTSELLSIDLTQPYATDSNGRIQRAIEKQGNSVSKDVIAYWLKLAHENSI